MNPKVWFVLFVVALHVAGLAACAAVDEDPLIFDLPTAAPTPAPEDTVVPIAPTPSPEDTATPEVSIPAPEEAATPTVPPASGPRTFTGEGVRNDYASDGTVCLVYQPATLVVRGDGTAELNTFGADIIDHATCRAGTSEETWYMNGLVDDAAQSVTFQTCNFGNFTADGALSFAQGVLAGEVSCTNQEGVKFITLVIGE